MPWNLPLRSHRLCTAAALLTVVVFAALPGAVRADDASVTQELTPVYEKVSTLYSQGDLEQIQNYVLPEVTWKGADGVVHHPEEIAGEFLRQRASQRNVKVTMKIAKLMANGNTAIVEVTQSTTADQVSGGKTVPYTEDTTRRDTWVKGSDGAWRLKYLETSKLEAKLDGKSLPSPAPAKPAEAPKA